MIHFHKYEVVTEKLYNINKDIEGRDMSDFGFTRTYEVNAYKILKCSKCEKTKKVNVFNHKFYQDNPLDKDRFMKTVLEIKNKGYIKSELF